MMTKAQRKTIVLHSVRVDQNKKLVISQGEVYETPTMYRTLRSQSDLAFVNSFPKAKVPGMFGYSWNRIALGHTRAEALAAFRVECEDLIKKGRDIIARADDFLSQIPNE